MSFNFVVDHFKSLNGKYFCISSKGPDNYWQDTYFTRDALDDIPRFLEQHAEKDLYFGLLGLKDKSRKTESVVPSKILFADIDGVPESEFEKFPPTILIQSSPGRFVGIWKTTFNYTEELNKRLTYEFGFDKGGWDPGQVLRIPGTKNYKYTARPEVRLMYDDGEIYSFEKFNEIIPERHQIIHGNDFDEIYHKYAHGFSTELIQMLTAKSDFSGDRSKVFWKLINLLLDHGVTREDIFTLTKNSVYNKFTGRSGDERLNREIGRAIDKSCQVLDDGEEPFYFEDIEEDEENTPFFALSLDQVEEEVLDWLWKPYLARGEVTIMESDPGVGKSYLAQVISGSICDGTQPSSKLKTNFEQGNVCYLDFENSAGTVTKRRMVDNGFKHLNHFFQEETPFSIDDHKKMHELLEGLSRLKPELVVFDTLNSYIGKTDINKGSETQQAFRIFVQIARRFNCAVLVLRHLTKNSSGPAIYRGSGSIAFTGLARVVMTLARNPQIEDEVLGAAVKLNIGKKPKPFTFRIKGLPDKGKFTDRSELVFGEESPISIEDALTGKITESNVSRDFVTEWVKTLLSDGQKEKAVILSAASERGIDEGELMAVLGIIADRNPVMEDGKKLFYYTLKGKEDV